MMDLWTYDTTERQKLIHETKAFPCSLSYFSIWRTYENAFYF